MEWLRELLKDKELTEDQIKSIVTGVEKRYQGYVPKHRFDEVNTAKKQYKADLKNRENQLVNFKKYVNKNKMLKKQIIQLQKNSKKKDEEYQAKIKDMAIKMAIKLAITEAVYEHLDLINNLFDKTKIEINVDGTIKSGLDEQLKSLRESKAFLSVKKDGYPNFKGVKPVKGQESGDKWY